MQQNQTTRREKRICLQPSVTKILEYYSNLNNSHTIYLPKPSHIYLIIHQGYHSNPNKLPITMKKELVDADIFVIIKRIIL